MPQGPGDEILDAIEKGAADTLIIKKYKLNDDQLKSFKSLHYGLSNQKMNYDEIESYYPEINSYFKANSRPTPLAPAPLPEPEDPLKIRQKQSLETVNRAMTENDDVVEKLIREGRYRTDVNQRLDAFAQSPRSDMPATQMLESQRLNMPQETTPENQPVAPEEIAQKKSEIQSDEQQARHFVNQVVKKKPEKAADIQSSMYFLDANERMKGSEDVIKKVNANLDKLEKGELKYDPQTGRLIQEEGFWDSLVTGAVERNKQLNDYDNFQEDDEKVIQMLEERRKNFDPDKPIPMSKGVGEIGQGVGMEWSSLLKGGAIAATVGRVAPQAVPWVTAAVTAPEYYERGYATALQESYDKLRNEGKSPEEALRISRNQATDEAELSAAEGAVSSFVGARIGLKPLPKFVITNGFKNAASSLLKHTAHYAAEQSIEGLSDGLVAGYLQDQKNLAAGEKGIFRTEGEGILDNVKSELTFSLAIGGITKIGEAATDPKTYKKLVYWLGRQPKETVSAKVGDMVVDGQLTPDQAKEAMEKIDAQRKVDKTVPPDIKDVSRQAMAEKIKERDGLEEEKKTVDKALHPPLQERIDKLNEEILEHSTHKKSEEAQAEEAEASEQPNEAVGPSLQQPGVEAEKSGSVETSMPGIEEQQAEQNETKEQGATEEAVSSEGPAIGQEAARGGAVDQEAAGSEEVSQAQQKHYENIIGSKPNTNTGRVPISPIIGGQPKKLSKIIGDVSKGLKQRLIYAKPGRRRAIGSYLPGFKGVKIRYNGDLDTTAHELGHAIDDQFDIYTEAAKNPAILAELSEFAKHGGSTPPKNHPNPEKYILQEGFAEWLRGHVVNPQQAEAIAPATTALYKGMVNSKFQDVINDFSNDVRGWAGATGRDITMANVEFKPDEGRGLMAKLFKRNPSNNQFHVRGVDRVAANFLNPLRVFERAWKYAKGIQGLSEVLPENDPIILSRILLGIDGKYGEVMEGGMIDGKGNVLKDENGEVKNLEWLIEPFDNTDLKSIENDMKDTIAYMISERVVEDMSKSMERGSVLSGTGGGVYSDFAVAQKTLNEFNEGDPTRLARIQEGAKRYREFSDDILRYAVEKGRLSVEQYKLIKQNNEHYVAMQRILESEPDQELNVVGKTPSKQLGSKSELIHRLKGSTKEVKNPYASLLETLYKTMRESDRNDTLRAFTDMLKDGRGMNEGQPKRISDIGIIGKEGDKETIPVFVNGKKENWIFQEDVYRALKGLDGDGFRVWKLFSAPARILRFTTTQFPTFAVRNWIRDTQDRLIKTTTGSGFSDLVGSKEDWKAIGRYGGLNSGYYFKDKNHYYGMMWEAMDEMAKNKKFILADPIRLKGLWHKYENLLYKSETSNRVAEYRSAFRDGKEKGYDDYNASIYAAFKARDLIDFAVMGHKMKILNQLIPFSNAAIQGLRSAAVSMQKNPIGFLGRQMVFSILPAAAAWAWNHRNEEDEKLYEELPDYVRDMFWNFRISPNNWVSIPKPYELSLPAAGMDRLLSKMYAGKEDAFKGYGGSVAKLLLPFDEGNISGPFQTIIEGKANYDFFRERNIIPPEEDPLNLALRHTETASRLGQLLQRATGIDARKMDHFIQRQFSYTGNFAIKASDIGKEESRHKFDLTDTGLFKQSPAYSAKSVQEMISFAKEWGLTKTPPYKGFNKIVGEYFSTEDEEEKERIANIMIDYSTALLDEWKKRKVNEFQEKKAEAKKAAKR